MNCLRIVLRIAVCHARLKTTSFCTMCADRSARRLQEIPETRPSTGMHATAFAWQKTRQPTSPHRIADNDLRIAVLRPKTLPTTGIHATAIFVGAGRRRGGAKAPGLELQPLREPAFLEFYHALSCASTPRRPRGCPTGVVPRHVPRCGIQHRAFFTGAPGQLLNLDQ